MRKYHQKKILGLIQTLGEGHAEAGRQLSAGKTETALGLLTRCLEAASRISGFIEQLEGEGTKTLDHLEKYGEIFNQINVDAGHLGINASFFEQLQKQLTSIENSARIDIKTNKIEMVFLPYKASMWDSMESVWRAANEDPDCDAYVVPIPYYDRPLGGSQGFGDMHCEGDQYPEDVPIIDWQKYNIEERHPDIIVIHSPFDEHNYVKSVHPYFYSKRLKECTDLLVYIPYFVSVDDVPEHFCKCTGVFYADKVILQSNKVRDTYIRIFEEIEKKNNSVGLLGNLEEKFIALGSPKFDKVINTKREECKIPDAWLKLIERPDGTRKKVILYNTSVFLLLNENERVLNKLRHVFEFFKERDDVVLLWRPHPMSEATYQSMRPHLHKEYLDIVAEYKQQGFGIYDDTSDLHRAIALSDAYYGDGASSLVALYSATGKQILIQNYKTFRKNLFFNHYTDFDGYYWTSSYYGNALYRIDKNTWEAEFMGAFPEESACSSWLYQHSVVCGGKIYFAPFRATAIPVFDPKTGMFERIPFKEIDEKTEDSLKCKSIFTHHFFYAAAYGQYVYFIPHCYNAILRLDTEAKKIEYLDDWLPALEECVNYPLVGRFYGVYQRNNTLYISARCANAVLELDMTTGKTRLHVINDKKLHFNGICGYGDDLYLLTFTDLVIKFNPNTGEVKRIGTGEGVQAGKLAPDFIDILYADGNLILIPEACSSGIIKINIATGERESHPNTSPIIQKDNNSVHYLFSRVSENKLLAFSHAEQRLEIIDIASLRLLQGMEIPLAEKHLEWIEQDVRSGKYFERGAAAAELYGHLSYETPLLELRMWLGLIPNTPGENIRTQFFSKMSANTDGNAGEMIYKMLVEKKHSMVILK
ncbi:hypothetical protein FACS189475_03950 [Betaproteobacteria bacterium]|nr:hypothetical protein FACS189475_03950 [Betaproteobacteria bacterium]